MIALADTHVHLYQCYNLTRAFKSAWENFSKNSYGLGHEVVRVLYLTERANCHVYRELSQRGREIVSAEHFTFHACSRPEVLRVERTGGGRMYLVAGRQIATAEKLEVLALNTLAEFSDAQSVKDSITGAQGSGAVPVLNWSLGKWMFGRGKLVSKIISESRPDDFLLGDVAARPLGWGEPQLLALGRSRGFITVAGSDPLPFPRDEMRIASYVSVVNCDGQGDKFDPESPSFFRELLTSRAVTRGIRGRRNTPWLAGTRLWRNSRARASGFPPCCM